MYTLSHAQVIADIETALQKIKKKSHLQTSKIKWSIEKC